MTTVKKTKKIMEQLNGSCINEVCVRSRLSTVKQNQAEDDLFFKIKLIITKNSILLQKLSDNGLS